MTFLTTRTSIKNNILRFFNHLNFSWSSFRNFLAESHVKLLDYTINGKKPNQQDQNELRNVSRLNDHPRTQTTMVSHTVYIVYYVYGQQCNGRLNERARAIK